MKKYVFMMSLAVFLVAACHDAKKGQIVIQGHITGAKNEMIHLATVTPEGLMMLDSNKLNDGDFAFTIPAETDSDKERVSAPLIYRIFLSPDNSLSTMAKGGDNITITAGAKSLIDTYRATGAEEAVLMWQLDSALKTFIMPTEQLYVLYRQNIGNDSARADIDRKYMVLLRNHRQYLEQFIKGHPRNMASYIAFYQCYNRRQFFDEHQNLDLLKSITDSLAEVYPNSPYIKVMKQKVEILEMQARQEKTEDNLAQ